MHSARANENSSKLNSAKPMFLFCLKFRVFFYLYIVLQKNIKTNEITN